MKAFYTAVSWITVGILILMLKMLSGTMIIGEGVEIELPEVGSELVTEPKLTAYIFNNGDKTFIFFDDIRYVVGDLNSMMEFGDHIAEMIDVNTDNNIMFVADCNVPCGDTIELAAIAKRNGISHVIFATADEHTRKIKRNRQDEFDRYGIDSLMDLPVQIRNTIVKRPSRMKDDVIAAQLPNVLPDGEFGLAEMLPPITDSKEKPLPFSREDVLKLKGQ